MQNNEDLIFINSDLLRLAEQRCQLELKNDPESRAALRSLAEIHRKLGNLGEAAAIRDRLFCLDPNDQESGYLSALLGGRDSQISPKGTHAAPFLLLKDFLPREFHNALIPFVLSKRDRFIPARVGQNPKYKPDVRRTLQLSPDWENADRFWECLAQIIPQALPRLHLAPFGRQSHVIKVRAYPDGHFYRIHMDAAPNTPAANRMISFVYFFHRQPRPYNGGDLLLFDSDIEANSFTKARFTRIIPQNNSIILFPPRFYHCVIPVRCKSQDFGDSRFVINGEISNCAPQISGAEIADDMVGAAKG